MLRSYCRSTAALRKSSTWPSAPPARIDTRLVSTVQPSRLFVPDKYSPKLRVSQSLEYNT